MSLRKLVVLIATCVVLFFSVGLYYFGVSPTRIFFYSVSLFLIFYVFVYLLLERYVYSKIKLIYKQIHNLKLGKELKDAMSGYVSEDPISDVETEVTQWMRDKRLEIDTLKKQEEFRKEFIGNVAHEFKTPLFAIQGYVDTILDDELEDADMAKIFLEKVQRNVERLGVLIHDLDAISKLESGALKLTMEKFDIGELIRETMDSLEMDANKKSIKLLYKNPPTKTMRVVADREKIRQVLVNLIENSLKYGKLGGRTKISVYELHEEFLVEVSDDGIGIEEKYLTRVFERFFRADSSRSQEVKGSGLGLSIVKHIIEAHQQTINVRSTSGVGSTFGFTLKKA